MRAKLRRALAALLLSLYVALAGATTHVNDGGTWRELQGVYVNDAGAWRTIQEIYVNDGGTWRSVFVNAVVTVSGETIQNLNNEFSAAASVIFKSTGIVQKVDFGGTAQIDASTDWIIPNGAASSAYEIRATLTSGSAPNNTGTLNTWQDLGTDRSWSNICIGDVIASSTLLIEIRRGGVTLGSGSYVIVCDGIPL